MNNQAELLRVLEDAQRNLQEKESDWNLHQYICVKPRPNGLLPVCCAKLVFKFQKAKDEFDKARTRLHATAV